MSKFYQNFSPGMYFIIRFIKNQTLGGGTNILRHRKS